MHRAGRVGGDEFDHHLFALAVIAAPVLLAESLDVAQNIGVKARIEEEIEEAGTRDLAAVKVGRGQVEVGDDGLGNFAGRKTEGARSRHGRVARPVAVAAIGGDLQREGGDFRLGKRAVRDGGLYRGLDGLSQFVGCLLYQL